MALSTFTGIALIPENSQATPGLWNTIFSTISANLDTLNSDKSILAASIGTTTSIVGFSSNTLRPEASNITISVLAAPGGASVALVAPLSTNTIRAESGNTILVLPYSMAFTTKSVDSGGEVFNVLAFGATGDGATDDAAAIRSAMSAAQANGGGTVVIPLTPSNTYLVKSTLTLAPHLTLLGNADYVPTLKWAGGNTAMVAYTGTAEAQSLNCKLENLQLVSSVTSQTGIGVRVRNFANFFAKRVIFSSWSDAIWADWGQGLYLDDCNVSLNKHGLKSGGTGPTPGIRASGKPHFMEWVHVRNTNFAQNVVDINDMGSIQANGGLTLIGNSFFESSVNTVATKVHYVHLVARKGIAIFGNTWESPQPRACISLDTVDLDAGSQSSGSCFAVSISGNQFLLNGGSGNTGIWVKGGSGIVSTANMFDTLGNATAHDVGTNGAGCFIGESTYSGTPITKVAQSGNTISIIDSNDTSSFVTTQFAGPVDVFAAGALDIANSSNRVRIYGGASAQIQLYPQGSTNAPFQIDNSPTGAGPQLRLYTQGFVAASLFSRQFVHGTTGLAIRPAYTFASDQSLGLYQSGTSALGLSYGQLQLPSGSALQPALALSSESSLGAYRSATSTLALSYGTLDLTASGAVTSVASLTIKSGANNSCGTAVLGSNGSVNVANTYVKTGDLIFLTDQTPGGTLGDLEIGGIRNSSGFTIQSTSVTDTSTVGWLIVRPG